MSPRAQNKLANNRLKTLPARGTLTVADIERVEVPALSAFSVDGVIWWADMDELEPETKSLWGRVDKEKLADKTIAPAFPGRAGSKVTWEAHTQALVDEYNDGTLPEIFIHIGKFPEDVTNLPVYPGLLRMKLNFSRVIGAHRTAPCCPPPLRLLHRSGPLLPAGAAVPPPPPQPAPPQPSPA